MPSAFGEHDSNVVYREGFLLRYKISQMSAEKIAVGATTNNYSYIFQFSRFIPQYFVFAVYFTHETDQLPAQ